MPSLAERFNKKWIENPKTGCWDWTGAGDGRKGYGKIKVAGKKQGAHRVSYELHIGPIPEGEGHHGTCVCHRCDRPCCVNPAHLFLGTMADNMRDRRQKGRQSKLKGAEHGRAKLGEFEAKSIKEILRRFPPRTKGPTAGVQGFLARWFGVSDVTISHIHRGNTWTHL